MSCYSEFFNVRRGWQSLNTGPRFNVSPEGQVGCEFIHPHNRRIKRPLKPKKLSHFYTPDGPTDRRIDGWTDGRIDGRTDRQMDRQTDERTEGHTDGRTDRWTDGRTDGQGDSYLPLPLGWRNLVPILPPANPLGGE